LTISIRATLIATMLTQLHDSLWVWPVPYRVMGLSLGRQLVAIRLANQQLWVNSPIPVTANVRTTLEKLGKIAHVVAPNRLHDECLSEFQTAYPAAAFHHAPGLSAQRPDLRFATELSDVAHPDWAPDLRQHLVRGMPKLNEVVFFHPPSRSLIITDLAFNLGPEGPFFTKLALRLNDAWGRFTPSRLCRSLMTDRAAVRASLDHILSWDFNRIIVGHGRNIESDGRARFAEAFAVVT
jgi:hypothetical protein